MKNLIDKIIIVTGASQGMGRAIAVQAARKGAAWVTLADIKDGESVAEEVRAHGAQAVTTFSHVVRPPLDRGIT